MVEMAAIVLGQVSPQSTYRKQLSAFQVHFSVGCGFCQNSMIKPLDPQGTQLLNPLGADGFHGYHHGIQIHFLLAGMPQGQLEPLVGAALGLEQNLRQNQIRLETYAGECGLKFLSKVGMDNVIVNPALGKTVFMAAFTGDQVPVCMEEDGLF